ncbi:MAG: DUF2398 family protein [Candidatus Rifleibacteriota bacterium]
MTDKDIQEVENSGEGLPIEKINSETSTAILNILTESPFFYAEDDPVRFNSLRRNRSAFAAFFHKFFGWRLYVDARLARLIKDKTFNPAIKPSQQQLFNLTSRLQCICFLILLEFYEHQCAELDIGPDDPENLKFTFSSYFDYVKKTMSEQLHKLQVRESELDQETRSLLSKLCHYRMLRVVEKAEDSGQAGELLIEALPGLNCYEGARMAESIISKSFGDDVDQEPVLDETNEAEMLDGEQN